MAERCFFLLATGVYNKYNEIIPFTIYNPVYLNIIVLKEPPMKYFIYVVLCLALCMGCQNKEKKETVVDPWASEKTSLIQPAAVVTPADEPIMTVSNPQAILIVERKSVPAPREEFVDRVIEALRDALGQADYKELYSDKNLRQQLMQEMAQMNLDPRLEGNYLQQSFTKANLVLYVTLARGQERETKIGRDVVKEWQPVLKINAQDLIGGQTYSERSYFAEQEGKLIFCTEGDTEAELFEMKVLPSLKRLMPKIVRDISTAAQPKPNLFKVIANAPEQEKREKLNSIFRKMEEKGLFKFEQAPYIAGANFCLLVTYNGKQSKLVDVLQEYVKPLHMKVEVQGYAIMLTPKPEEEF
jgi:hypothetical protein